MTNKTITFSPAEVRAYYSARIEGLKDRGAETRAACPIHGGKNENLSVDLETGQWYCHSKCGEGGDLIDFEMKLNGLQFKDAASEVSRLVGREVGQRRPEQAGIDHNPKETIYEYVDEFGETLSQVLRYDAAPGMVLKKNGKPKDFKQRRWNPHTKQWQWSLKAVGDLPAVRRVPYRLDKLLEARDKDVYFVEGEKCVHALVERGLEATCVMGGSDSWRPRDKYEEYFTHVGRVIILPDNDETGVTFAQRVYESLRGNGIQAVILDLGLTEPKADVVDWLKRHTVEELKALADKPVEEPQEPPEEPVRPPINNDQTNGRMAPPLVAELVLQDHDIVADPNENLYIYNGRYFEELPKGRMNSILLEADTPQESSTTRRRGEMAAYIKAKCNLPGGVPWNSFSEWEVPVENCVIDLRTSEAKRHERRRYLQNVIPHEFDPKAKCPLWLKFLDESFEGADDKADRIAAIQEFFGYVLMPRAHLKKAVILYGPANTGKSVALRVLEELVGEKNKCSIGLGEMSDPRKLYPIKGKYLNTIPEVTARTRLDDGGFKRLVSGGDSIEIDGKYRDAETITPFAKHLIACNNLPDIVDASDATHKRFVIIKFDNRIPEHAQDSSLTDKLIAELPGILSWAIHGAARLLENEEFTRVQSSIDEVARYKEEQNPVFQFVREQCVLDDPTAKIPMDAFRERFRKFYGGAVHHRVLATWIKQVGLNDNARFKGKIAIDGIRWAEDDYAMF